MAQNGKYDEPSKDRGQEVNYADNHRGLEAVCIEVIVPGE